MFITATAGALFLTAKSPEQAARVIVVTVLQ